MQIELTRQDYELIRDALDNSIHTKKIKIPKGRAKAIRKEIEKRFYEMDELAEYQDDLAI